MPSRSGVGGRTTSVQLIALLAVVFTALLAVPSFAAAEGHVFKGTFGAGTSTPANPYPLTEPTSVAVDNSAGPSAGDVYVTDPTNHRVEKFDAAGNFLLMFGKGVNAGTGNPNVCTNAGAPTDVCQTGTAASTPGGFETPAFLAVDGSTGYVYVADTADNIVTKFAPDGTLITAWGEGGQLAGSSATGTGSLETGSTLVESLTTESGAFSAGQEISAAGIPAGTTITAVNSGSLEISQAATATESAALSAQRSFGALLGIAADAAGDLIVLGSPSGPRLFEFSPSGNFTRDFRTGGISFINPTAGIAVDSAGDVYLVREAGFVAKIDPSGAELSNEFALAPATGGGLAVDPSTDELYVDSGTEVRRYDPSGNHLESFGSANLTAGAGLAVDSTSGVYATDTGAGNVAAFSLFGPFTASAPATAVTGTAATLHGRLAPTGGGEVTECHFEYVTAEAFGKGGFSSAKIVPCSPPPSYSSSTKVSAELSALNGGTTYRFRLAATDSNATNFSLDTAFTTEGPSVDSTSASGVSATTATLEAELNPHGVATTYHFEYDTVEYTEGGGPHGESTATASAGSGTTDVTRTAPINGLEPSTTYHFRVIAQNSLGTTEGPDRSFTTQGTTAATLLPDDRAWELVSPPNKHGVPLESLSIAGNVIQAAADGSGLAYAAAGSIGTAAPGNRSLEPSQLLATRGAAGWTTADISTPHRAAAGIGGAGDRSEYKLFSTDLSGAAVEPFGATPLSPQASERTPYRREPDGSYTPLVNPANVPDGTEFGGVEGFPEAFDGGVGFITATPDLGHLLGESPKALTEEFAPGFEPTYESPRNIYEWSADTLQLVSQIPPGSAIACGGTGPACLPASEAGRGSDVGLDSQQVRHAISADGSRVVFHTAFGPTGSPALYLRDSSTAETIALDAAQGGSGESGQGEFQDASADGSRVFFTDASRLTADSTAANGKPDLYMCQIEEDAEGHLACALTDLTANAVDPGEPAAVQGIIAGVSVDGSAVYFVAQGALTAGEGAVPGNCRLEAGVGLGQCNLYRYDVETATTRLIAVLSGADFPDWRGGAISGAANLGRLTARVSPNGDWLAFMSEQPLTGYDNRDAASAQRDEEVFLYDATANEGKGKLFCASCNPTGARPTGVQGPSNIPHQLVDGPANWGSRWFAANVPGWTQVDELRALYQSRYLSDSGRLFFNAADALVPSDSNGTEDVYQFEPPGVGDCTEQSPAFAPANGGCVSLISSGTSREESAFLDASESGDDVFFLTASKLVPRDEDKALDVYDARVGGGEPSVVKPVECSGDACQQPAVPAGFETPGTALLNGPGNLAECPKGKVKKGGKCVKKHKAKRHKKSHKKHKRTTSHKRGGQK